MKTKTLLGEFSSAWKPVFPKVHCTEAGSIDITAPCLDKFVRQCVI